MSDGSLRSAFERPWTWAALALTAVVIGSQISWLAVAHVRWPPDTGPYMSIRATFQMPVPVVFAAGRDGWAVLGPFWATMLALAYCGARFARTVGGQRGGVSAVFGAQALLGLALAAYAVTFSPDLYAYVMFGRLLGVHGINPYFLPEAIKPGSDAILRACLSVLGNPPPADNYGPLWSLMDGALSRVETSASLAVQLFAHRAIAVLFAMLATAGVVRLMRRLSERERLKRMAFFGLHPLVLYEAAAGGHNDIMAVAFAIWGFAVVEELPLVAGLLIGASIAVKYVSVVALPFLVLKAWRRSRTAGLLAAALALGVPILLFKPFWIGPLTVASLAAHSGRIAMSLVFIAAHPFFATGHSRGAVLPGLASLPLLGLLTWPRIVQLAFAGAFAVVFVHAAGSAWVTGRALFVWRAVASFIWSLPLIHPWYALWLMPALVEGEKWATYAWWFGLFMFLRYALEVALISPILQMLLTAVIFVAPLILAVQGSPRTAHQDV